MYGTEKVIQRTGTRHIQIAEELVRMFSEQTVGSRLLPIRTLMEHFSVSQTTIEKSLRDLEECDFVRRTPRRGYFRGAGQKSNWMPAGHDADAIYFASPLERDHRFYGIILAGVEAAAHAMGHEIKLLCLAGRDAGQLPLPDPRQTAGVIFSPLHAEHFYELNSAYLDVFDSHGLNYVTVDCPVIRNGFIRGSFVGTDGYSAMREVAQYLLRIGHRKIGSIRTFPEIFSSELRYFGLRDELRVRKVEDHPQYHVIAPNEPLIRQGRSALRALMELDDPPTAIACSHSTLALNAMEELRTLGKRVPEDVSIVGFDNDGFTESLGIATVEQPLEEVGRHAVKMLLEMKSGPVRLRRQEFLPCRLIPRQSVGPVETVPQQEDNDMIPGAAKL